MAKVAFMITTVGFLLLFIIPPSSATFRIPGPWGWTCINETCVRQEQDGVRDLQCLATCKLTCGRYRVIWPKPTGYTNFGDETVNFLLESMTLGQVDGGTEEGRHLMQEAFSLFKDNVAKNYPKESEFPQAMGPFMPSQLVQKPSHQVTVVITLGGHPTRLTLTTAEAYTLEVSTEGSTTNVRIIGSNFFGARHALETLSQLIEYNELDGCFQILSKAVISDSPAFSYRGILLDTSRNFFSVKAIKRTLDAMAANKLNTFHWHITDSHSFPLYLESLPDMAYYGAYSPHQVYHPTDVYNLVEYARVRGIRVVPEVSGPAHAGNGWQWTEKQGLGKLALCVNQEPWKEYCQEPPCGQLNVVNDNTYVVLGQIYKEMAKLFGPLELFHFGGTDVTFKCWNTTEEIISHMEKQGLGRESKDFFKLWSHFQAMAYNHLITAVGGKLIPGILWASQLTNHEAADGYLDPHQYILQIWNINDDQHIDKLLKKGFRLIFSNYDSWNLDCGFGAWVGEGNNWCSPYKGWQKVYDNSPTYIVTNITGTTYSNLILGGEASLWSEQVDEATIDSRLWPRGSALAERLWSNPSTNWEPAETRFIHHRQRLLKRGIMADRIQPQWCHQNEELCYL